MREYIYDLWNKECAYVRRLLTDQPPVPQSKWFTRPQRPQTRVGLTRAVTNDHPASECGYQPVPLPGLTPSAARWRQWSVVTWCLLSSGTVYCLAVPSVMFRCLQHYQQSSWAAPSHCHTLNCPRWTPSILPIQNLTQHIYFPSFWNHDMTSWYFIMIYVLWNSIMIFEGASWIHHDMPSPLYGASWHLGSVMISSWYDFVMIWSANQDHDMEPYHDVIKNPAIDQ